MEKEEEPSAKGKRQKKITMKIMWPNVVVVVDIPVFNGMQVYNADNSV